MNSQLSDTSVDQPTCAAISVYAAATSVVVTPTNTAAKPMPRRASGYAATNPAVTPDAIAATPISVLARNVSAATTAAIANEIARGCGRFNASTSSDSVISPSAVPCSALYEYGRM